jgi:hypothetical protein
MLKQRSDFFIFHEQQYSKGNGSNRVCTKYILLMIIFIASLNIYFILKFWLNIVANFFLILSSVRLYLIKSVGNIINHYWNSLFSIDKFKIHIEIIFSFCFCPYFIIILHCIILKLIKIKLKFFICFLLFIEFSSFF